jgi:hypothetical protein
MSDQSPRTSPAHRVLREPTFHFVLLAGLLFAAAAVLRPDDRYRIEIDRDEVIGRIQEIEAEGDPLTPAERTEVEAAYIAERILVREARAMGLDDDPRIDDILVQKMLHVLSADVIQPGEGELETFYEENRSRYVASAGVSFEEIIIPTPEPLPAPLLAQMESGLGAEDLVTDLPMRRDAFGGVPSGTLLSLYGPETSEMIQGAVPGRWVGPYHTVRGQHWFRVTGRVAAEPTPLEAVRERVRLDWIAEWEEERLQARVAELRGRYSVVVRGEGTER